MFCTGKEQLTCNSEKMGCEGCYFNDDKNKDEIKIGDYIRNKDGYIDKVERIVYDELEKKNYYACEKSVMASGFKEDIVKHSSNIIDLIEVGDYVNGEIVIDIGENGLYLGYADDDENYSIISIDKSEIKSLVTKEQFQSVEFKVED